MDEATAQLIAERGVWLSIQPRTGGVPLLGYDLDPHTCQSERHDFDGGSPHHFDRVR
jgi:hypothetical protein